MVKRLIFRSYIYTSIKLHSTDCITDKIYTQLNVSKKRNAHLSVKKSLRIRVHNRRETRFRYPLCTQLSVKIISHLIHTLVFGLRRFIHCILIQGELFDEHSVCSLVNPSIRLSSLANRMNWIGSPPKIFCMTEILAQTRGGNLKHAGSSGPPTGESPGG